MVYLNIYDVDGKNTLVSSESISMYLYGEFLSLPITLRIHLANTNPPDNHKSIYFQTATLSEIKITNEDNPMKPYITEEIAKEMGIDEEKVREILKIAQDPVSLETPIGEEEDSHLGDFIPDDETPAPAEAASATILREVIERELHTLTPREEHVIKLRFGLYDGRTRTLEEVGQEFEITRERIRQIEAKALRKLRHPSRARHLKGFLD